MADWWGYAGGVLLGVALGLAVGVWRSIRANRDATEDQAGLAAIKHERDAISAKLRATEHEVAELRLRIAEADAQRFAEAERGHGGAFAHAEVTAVAEIDGARSALVRALNVVAQIRDRVDAERTRLTAAAEQAAACGPAIDVVPAPDQEMAELLERLHNFEIDWLHEHTALGEARQRIAELEDELHRARSQSEAFSGARPRMEEGVQRAAA